MANKRTKSLAQKFQEKENSRVADYDPESLLNGRENDKDISDGSGSDGDGNDHDGTEHYAAVGQSKLRKRAALTTLGPRYHGSRISRAALESQGQDDDGEGEDDDGDEDEEEEESFVTAREDESVSDSGEDSEQAPARSASGSKSRSRPVAADYITAEWDGAAKKGSHLKSTKNIGEEEGWAEEGDDTAVEEAEGESQDEDAEEDEDETMGDTAHEDDVDSDSDEDEDDDEIGDEEDSLEEDDDDVFGLNGGDSEDDKDGGAPLSKQPLEPTADQLARVAQDRQKILDSLSEAAKKEAEKGMAIRNQRAAFDGLLNIRIRLQKALIAANTFHVLEEPAPARPDNDDDGYKAAEDAALQLWDALGDLRSRYEYSEMPVVGEKRKRESDDSQELWEEMKAYAERQTKTRNTVLEKWSSKMRSNESKLSTAYYNKNKALRPLVMALEDQLRDPNDRLVKRSRVPRSCAPTQVARHVAEDDGIYDDADFYQLLLKELVDQRTVESASASQMVHGSGTAVISAAAAGSTAKQRKLVNRKASKGRVMRFTVHEKLLSFMAPEDRRAWEQSAIDRFFGTLFGRKMELDEDGSDDEDEEMAEEAGLRLFRN